MRMKTYRVLLEQAPGAEPVFALTQAERQPGDEVALWSDAGDETVYLVETRSPGLRRIYFQNGPLPGSGEYHYMM